MSAQRKRLIVIALAIVVAAVVGLLVFLPRHQPPPAIAGMVRQTEIRIAPEITGRLASLEVRAGQQVRKGELEVRAPHLPTLQDTLRAQG